jgi:hypothetical protein
MIRTGQKACPRRASLAEEPAESRLRARLPALQKGNDRTAMRRLVYTGVSLGSRTVSLVTAVAFSSRTTGES